ncbi:uncharacterized protein LOC143422659 [Xylocopa sonorina]|uniref:uncharacterized protein LOC143422659 n=1 Tax=Xylocopa sonorina TaxID=1818115 RepID=UPI00403B0496
MESDYVEDSLSIEMNDGDAYKEKTRIAKAAATTLCRLNGIMRQMKDWRDDRVKLRSNVWRLKLALRVAARETDDALNADPLIEHQRAEVERLETSNKELKKEMADIKAALLDGGYVTRVVSWKSDDKLEEVKREYLAENERLNNEIQYLKSRLSEAEDGHEHSSESEHLKCKLKHFMMVDHTVEIIFTDIVNKVAETIANLSEELVNANERLHRARAKNDSMYVEIDQLRAMLRFKNGDVTDYQRRIVELENLTRRLNLELSKLKSSYESRGADTNYQGNLSNVERLANDLRDKLRNDHEALLAAGDPCRLKYLRKIVELRASLRQLQVELGRTGGGRRLSRSDKMAASSVYSKQLPMLDGTLQEIDAEIDRLRNNHAKRYCRIGGIEGLEYLNKIEELGTIVEEARATMNGLNCRTGGDSREWKGIEKLEGFVGKVCYGIKQLEVIVASGDRSGTIERIEQLEETVVRLKSESNEKDERADGLRRELLDMESLLGQRGKEVENAQRKITALMEENRDLRGRVKKAEEKASAIQREQEGSRIELEQLQQVKREASVTRKRLQTVQADKEGLLKETGKIRGALQKKNEEIKTVLAEREAMAKALNGKITDLIKNLQIASKENEKLRSKVNESERVKRETDETISVEKEKENARRKREESKRTSVELGRLKTKLAAAEDSLDKANREVTDLGAQLKHLADDKARLEAKILQLESQKEMLAYQLDVEKSMAEERLKELANLKSNRDESDTEKARLTNENEQLRVELTNSKFEKELLEKSLKHTHAKCSELENETDKHKSELECLRDQMSNYKMAEENLINRLKETRTELLGAEDKVKQLELENSRLRDDVNGLASKNADFDGRVGTLLSEKNELVRRINELAEKNVALRDQLNKIETANEYSSVELKKLRTECDETKSENGALQMALDEARKSNETLREASDEMKLKLNEIYNEYRILENQLRILEMMNATLKKEKELLEQEYVNSLRSKVTKKGEKELVAYGEGNVQIIEKSMMSGTKRNGKPGKRANGRMEATEEREILKKLTMENESLRFEVLNLRNQNFDDKMQLVHVKDELRRRESELTKSKEGEVAIKPISNKLEIMSLYCKEINNYSDPCRDRSSVRPYVNSMVEQGTGLEIERLLDIMNKLKLENIALKMEMDTLRYNLFDNFTVDEKWRNELRNATEEIQALRIELTKLRDEKESLWIRLGTAGTKLDQLESEKAALKDELSTLRKVNSDLKHKTNELRYNYQELKERSVGFEGCIVRAIRKMKKYTVSTENRDNIGDELKLFLKKYISNEEVLRSIEQEIDVEL